MVGVFSIAWRLVADVHKSQEVPGFVDEHRPLDSCRIEASVLFEKQRKTGTAIGNADDSLPVAESAVEGEHIHAGCVTVGDGVAMLVLETAEVLGGEGGATR